MLQWIQKNSKQTIKAVILLGVILGAAFLFFSPNTVLAQSIADPSSTLNQGIQVIEQPLGLPSTDIRLIVARIIRAALGLLGIVLVVLIMYAGFLWMTAGGNEDQIAKSKTMIKNAVIGLIIILSAYTIVWFVMRMLGVGEGGGNGGPGAGGDGTQNFRGSGALGQIVKDHYPLRDQIDVPRNVKIAITFRKPINLANLVVDRSGSGSQPDGILGNCRANMTDWRNDCDRVTSTAGILSDDFISIKNTVTGQPIEAVAITATSSTDPATGVSGVYTITLKPLPNLSEANGGLLGSSTEKIGYTVRLGKELTLDLAGLPKAFDNTTIGNNYYEWKFTCDTKSDTTPPYVNNVYPDRGQNIAKNTVIQIDFSEAMDPSGVQGMFLDATEGYYYLAGQNVFLKSNNSTKPLGTFNLVNNYRTLEFTPSIPCGTNACGGKIYCLPVCDKGGANCNQDNYEILLKAAATLSASTFEAQPFTGIMDISGNALDGNNDKRVSHATSTLPVFNNWKQPDNDFWSFVVKNEMDLTAPYLESVYPGLDAGNVTAKEKWEMAFSKRMRVEPMYNIGIEEKPTPAERGDNTPLCKVPLVFWGENTTTTMNHCAFLDGVKQYYFPSLDSSIEDTSFNCFYPGKGPDVTAIEKVSLKCEENGANCCDVISDINRSFCCNGSVASASSTICINSLRSISN